jgi:hypothetical protein
MLSGSAYLESQFAHSSHGFESDIFLYEVNFDETETEERLQQLAHLNLNDPCSDRISLHSFSSASSGVSWDSNNSDPPLSPNIPKSNDPYR